MIRKFNYTDRKKIPSDYIKITLRNESKQAFFNAEIKPLDSLNIQDDAILVLEVYDRGSYQRFDFGTVEFPTPPKAYESFLSEIQEVDAVSFRLRAIDKSESIGKIVASTISIRVWAEEVSEARKRSLLPVKRGPIGDAVWLVNFDVPDDGEPELIVNKEFDEIAIREILRTDAYFTSLIYPAVLNEILTEAIIVRGIKMEEDSDGWERKWLKFVYAFSGVSPLPEGANHNYCREWINEIVSQFSYQQSMLKNLLSKLRESR
jgi:hypothetical protein|tara:strand:- start:1345 stop:2130 length:786 start_codon:yes stop_codon:yes gene_type:complete